MCTVEGDGIEEEDESVNQPQRAYHNPSTSASEDEGGMTDASIHSDNSVLDQGGLPPKKKRKRQTKANESMQEMVNRVTRFMSQPVS